IRARKLQFRRQEVAPCHIVAPMVHWFIRPSYTSLFNRSLEALLDQAILCHFGD
ncbi:hypothetical protein M404DRAFT_1005316, partial [Pisolithus tinctorius Marx 270]